MRAGRHSRTSTVTFLTIAVAAIASLIAVLYFSGLFSQGGTVPASSSPTSPADVASDGGGAQASDAGGSQKPLAPFDENGEPIGDTPDKVSAVKPAAAPPDPISKTPAKRYKELQIPRGFEGKFSTAPNIADKPDPVQRGWQKLDGYPVHLELTPRAGKKDEYVDLHISAAVLYVGDEADFQTAMVGGEDDIMDVKEVKLAQGRGALMKPRDGAGPSRIDADANGELITVIVLRPTDDGVQGPTDEEIVEFTNSYINSLYTAGE